MPWCAYLFMLVFILLIAQAVSKEMMERQCQESYSSSVYLKDSGFSLLAFSEWYDYSRLLEMWKVSCCTENLLHSLSQSAGCCPCPSVGLGEASKGTLQYKQCSSELNLFSGWNTLLLNRVVRQLVPTVQDKHRGLINLSVLETEKQTNKTPRNKQANTQIQTHPLKELSTIPNP